MKIPKVKSQFRYLFKVLQTGMVLLCLSGTAYALSIFGFSTSDVFLTLQDSSYALQNTPKAVQDAQPKALNLFFHFLSDDPDISSKCSGFLVQGRKAIYLVTAGHCVLYPLQVEEEATRMKRVYFGKDFSLLTETDEQRKNFYQNLDPDTFSANQAKFFPDDDDELEKYRKEVCLKDTYDYFLQKGKIGLTVSNKAYAKDPHQGKSVTLSLHPLYLPPLENIKSMIPEDYKTDFQQNFVLREYMDVAIFRIENDELASLQSLNVQPFPIAEKLPEDGEYIYPLGYLTNENLNRFRQDILNGNPLKTTLLQSENQEIASEKARQVLDASENDVVYPVLGKSRRISTRTVFNANPLVQTSLQVLKNQEKSVWVDNYMKNVLVGLPTVSPGISGGPVVNANGKLIGISQALGFSPARVDYFGSIFYIQSLIEELEKDR